LAALIQAIQPSPDDVIVALGDYIDGGPDSQGVIEQLIALSGRCQLVPLLGNHEEMLFGAIEGGRSDLDFWLRFGGSTTLASYQATTPRAIPTEHIDFLRGCLLYHETKTHIFVHANLYPNQRLTDQPRKAILWDHVQPDRLPRHYSGKRVIVGHTPQMDGQVLDLGFAVCIDTGSGHGGRLTAFDVHSGRIWQTTEEGQIVNDCNRVPDRNVLEKT
jgi:serine/threonine protein phosphatase 1